MPKLLSRSKHEEFKSNSALPIRNQGKKSRKCMEIGAAGNFVGCEICLLLPLFTLLTVPSCCPFDLLTFVPLFGFLPILSLVIAFDFDSFCNFA